MAKTNIGKSCPYCQYPIKIDSEVVICSDCLIPHHQECWQENGGCTTFGCKGAISLRSGSREILDITLEERADERITLPITKKTGKMLAALITCGVVMLLIVNTYLKNQPLVNIGNAVDPSVIAALDADYFIDYENGTIPIGDLPIGARVVDPGWEWEYRLGVDYSGSDWVGDPTPPGEVKPVTWVVVARDHYDGLEPHVTLLSEDLIALYRFDNSTGWGYENDEYGYNHWGDSGTANATHGLRPWLNSTGIHAGEGFYRAFSESFTRAVLTTTVPNKEWENGSTYSTSDNVFIPSSTELGDEEHDWTYRIGDVYAYFTGAGDRERVALMFGDGWYEIIEKIWGKDQLDGWGIYGNNWNYWTRSPGSNCGYSVRRVRSAGEFYFFDANYVDIAVRPALNLKSGILVSEIDH